METFTVSIFAIGVTQLLKQYGILSGKVQLQIAAVALFALAGYLSAFQPMMWEQLSMIFVGLGLTGSVGLAKEFKK